MLELELIVIITIFGIITLIIVGEKIMRYVNCGNVYIGNIVFVLLVNSETLDRKYLKIENNLIVPPSKQETDLLNNIYQTHPKSLREDDFSFDTKNKRFKETNFKKVFIRVGSVVLSVAIAIGAGAKIRDCLKIIKDQPTTSFSHYEKNEQRAYSEAAKRFELAISSNPNLSKPEQIYIFQTIIPFANDWGNTLDIPTICSLLSNLKIFYTGEQRGNMTGEYFNENIYLYNGIKSFAEVSANSFNQVLLRHELFHLIIDNKEYKAIDDYAYNGITINEYPHVESITIEEGLVDLLAIEYGDREDQNYSQEIILTKLMIELFSLETILEVGRTGSWDTIFDSIEEFDEADYSSQALQLNVDLLNIHSAASEMRRAYRSSNITFEDNMQILLNDINDIYNGLNKFKANIANSKYATELGSLSDSELSTLLIKLATYFGCKRTYQESLTNFMKLYAELYQLKYGFEMNEDRLVNAYFDLLSGSNNLITNDAEKGITHKANMTVEDVEYVYFNVDKRAEYPNTIITFKQQFPEFNNLTDDEIYELVKADTTGKYEVSNTTVKEELSDRYYQSQVKGR